MIVLKRKIFMDSDQSNVKVVFKHGALDESENGDERPTPIKEFESELTTLVQQGYEFAGAPYINTYIQHKQSGSSPDVYLIQVLRKK
jgi:hypothetical protein